MPCLAAVFPKRREDLHHHRLQALDFRGSPACRSAGKTPVLTMPLGPGGYAECFGSRHMEMDVFHPHPDIVNTAIGTYQRIKACTSALQLSRTSQVGRDRFTFERGCLKSLCQFGMKLKFGRYVRSTPTPWRNLAKPRRCNPCGCRAIKLQRCRPKRGVMAICDTRIEHGVRTFTRQEANLPSREDLYES